MPNDQFAKSSALSIIGTMDMYVKNLKTAPDAEVASRLRKLAANIETLAKSLDPDTITVRQHVETEFEERRRLARADAAGDISAPDMRIE